MIGLSCISPIQLAVFGSVIAIVLSKNQSADELNVIGNLTVGVGGIMLTIAAQEQFLESKKQDQETKSDLSQQVLQSQQQIRKLEQKGCR